MFRVLLTALLLTGCAVKHHVHYRPCANLEDGETRPDCLIDICPCEYPWAPGFDPCCKPQGLQEVVR
jgi:hypothetical protein